MLPPPAAGAWGGRAGRPPTARADADARCWRKHQPPSTLAPQFPPHPNPPLPRRAACRAVEQVPISKHASLAQHALQHEKVRPAAAQWPPCRARACTLSLGGPWGHTPGARRTPCTRLCVSGHTLLGAAARHASPAAAPCWRRRPHKNPAPTPSPLTPASPTPPRRAAPAQDCYIDAFQIHVHAPATAAVSPQATLHTYMRSFWQSSPAMWPERAVLAAGRGLARLTGAAADASEEEAADLHSDALPPVGSTLAHGAWRVVDVSSDAGSAELLASWGEGASMSGLTWLAVKPDAGAAQPGHVLQFGSALWGEGYKPSPQSMAYSLHRAYSKVLLYVAAWQYERQLRQMVQTA